jgi:hypothetical protein
VRRGSQDKLSLYINRFYLLHQRLRRMKGWYKPAIAAAASQDSYVEARGMLARPSNLYGGFVSVFCLLRNASLAQHAGVQISIYRGWSSTIAYALLTVVRAHAAGA